jgi:hypothetical protein
MFTALGIRIASQDSVTLAGYLFSNGYMVIQPAGSDSRRLKGVAR